MVQSVVFMVWDTGPSGYWTHEFQTWYRAFMVTGHEGSGYGTGTIWIYICVCVCVCVCVCTREFMPREFTIRSGAFRVLDTRVQYVGRGHLECRT